jgi:hypothetical protein
MPSIRRDKQEQTSEKKPSPRGHDRDGEEGRGVWNGRRNLRGGGGRIGSLLNILAVLPLVHPPLLVLGRVLKNFCCRVLVFIGSDDVAECLQVTWCGVAIMRTSHSTPRRSQLARRDGEKIEGEREGGGAGGVWGLVNVFSRNNILQRYFRQARKTCCRKLHRATRCKMCLRTIHLTYFKQDNYFRSGDGLCFLCISHHIHSRWYACTSREGPKRRK